MQKLNQTRKCNKTTNNGKKCKKGLLDGGLYCYKHQQMVDKKIARRKEQRQNARKKYKEADEARHEEQLQMARKKYRESDKGKLMKQNQKEQTLRNKYKQPLYNLNIRHRRRIGDHVRIFSRDPVGDCRYNMRTGIITEDLEECLKVYAVDIGEKECVYIEDVNVHNLYTDWHGQIKPNQILGGGDRWNEKFGKESNFAVEPEPHERKVMKKIEEMQMKHPELVNESNMFKVILYPILNDCEKYMNIVEHEKGELTRCGFVFVDFKPNGELNIRCACRCWQSLNNF